MATAWAVGALAARRAGALGPPPRALPLRLHRGLLRAAVWTETLAGFVCVHPEGCAVISVVPPHRRDQRRFFLVILAHDVPVAAALAVALVWWWPAAVAGLVAMGLVMAAVAAGERRPGPVRARMAAVTPSCAHQVRNFFADAAHKGAGRMVLGAVCRQADEAGHVLYLDTVAGRLVDYYAEFGFEVRATEALPRGGETVSCRRMVREPVKRTHAVAAGIPADAAHTAVAPLRSLRLRASPVASSAKPERGEAEE
jgi:hypothetical protein